MFGTNSIDDPNKNCSSCGRWSTEVFDEKGFGWCDKSGFATPDFETCDNWQTGRADTEDDGYPD